MKLYLLFVVAPVVELFVLVKTGQSIGFLNTLGLLVLSFFIGSAVIKRAGMKMWGRFVEQMQAGNEPSKEIADGVCILLAGLLFIAPGFISDVVAILLLFPPTRALFRRWLMRRRGLGSLGRIKVINATYGGANPGTGRPRSTNITDVTGTETRGTETRGELDQ